MKKLFNKKAFALLLCLVLALTALLTVTAFADTAPADGTAAQDRETGTHDDARRERRRNHVVIAHLLDERICRIVVRQLEGLVEGKG